MQKAYAALAIAGFALLSTGVSAYQIEGGLSYIDFDGDDSAIGLDVEFHFNDVDTSGLPLAEAAFLRHSSNVFGGFATTDESETDTINLGVELFMDALYLSAAADLIENDFFDETLLTAEIGFLLQEGFLIAAGVTIADEAETNDIFARAKYVSQMAGDTAINIEGGLTVLDDGDDTLVIELLGDYYFNPGFSAGVSLTEIDASGAKTEIGVQARYFFTPMISGEVAYLTNSGGADGVDTIGVRGAIRF